ncbi:type IV secretory system conjugative DNA transfer family protein [Candidatus Latescibacterota bacterium]
MSVTQQLLKRSESQIVGSIATEIIRREATKGCQAIVAPTPVLLEPPYLPPSEWLNTKPVNHGEFTQQPTQNLIPPLRFTAWLPPKHELDWIRAERFLKILSGASHRIGFEVSGNSDNINFGFLAYKEDAELLQSALKGEYFKSEISVNTGEGPVYKQYLFKDIFPSPPYHHLLTQPIEFETSPYDACIRTLSRFPKEITGFVQVLFEPAQNDWHRNVEALTDLEYRSKAVTESVRNYSRPQMLPSTDISEMSREITMKAHSDKPFFFAALRVGIKSSNDCISHEELSGFTNMFYHGGKPLQWLDSYDYRGSLSEAALYDLIRHGTVYHPGFLINSAELAGLVHLPSMIEFAEEELPIDFAETIIASPKAECLDKGLHIGSYWHGDKECAVSIPDEQRMKATHIIGLPGEGKSFLIKHMILRDIKIGRSVALIDPHGDCAEEMLEFIPEERVNDTIYLDFGHPEWIPIFNPFVALQGQDLSRTANNLISAIKSYIADTGWGDRLENILRFGFHAMLHIQGMTFLDLYKLLHPQSANDPERNRILAVIRNTVTEETALEFWLHEFNHYRPDDLASSKNKITKLIFGGPVAAMLSQPENRISFRDIMNSNKILLVNLSRLESEHQRIIGAFLLSFFYQTALERSEVSKEQRNPFYLYCDEAHKLATGNIEVMLAEMRKFNVSLTLAHQQMSQFTTEQQDALTGTGTSIIFRTNSGDAEHLAKQLIEKAEPIDIMRLKHRQAIVRINNQVTRIKTPDLKDPPQKNFKDLIINVSRQRYCRKRSDLSSTFSIPDDMMHDNETKSIFNMPIHLENQYEEFK